MSSFASLEVNLTCIMVITILCASSVHAGSGPRERLYQLMLFSANLFCLFDLIATCYQGETFFLARSLLWFCNISYFVVSILFSYFWVLYSMYLLFGRCLRWPAISLGAALGAAALLFISAPWNGLGFTLDAVNVYARGPLIWVHWAATFPCALIPSAIAPYTNAPKWERLAVSIFALLPLGTGILQAAAYGITASQVGMAGGLMILYTMLQSNAVDNAILEAAKMDALSNTDSLTGLPNRRAYDNRLDAVKDAPWVGLVFADLNGLKQVNDTLGHKAGDQKICTLSRALCDYFPREDVYRISGDEFMVICTEPTRYHANITSLVRNLDETAACGCSDGKGADVMALISQAEERMYRSKQQYHEKYGSYR